MWTGSERLILREYTEDDFEPLFSILSDAEIMANYPEPFDRDKVRLWIELNQRRYVSCGYGLWAVVMKETDELIGDCGLTIQNIDGVLLPEIGYHINKQYWRRGYGSEAAAAVRDWAFENTDHGRLYSYMRSTNIASYSTAESNGMKRVREYESETNGTVYVYEITRTDWEKLKGIVDR